MNVPQESPLPVVIVTGAAGGIGRATCDLLAARGWQVVATDRREMTDPPASVLPHPIDLTDEAGVVEMIRSVLLKFGRLDAIVSNAGISEFRPLGATSLGDWNRVLATNLTPAFLLAREAETALRAAGGSMVLIASTRAHMSEPDTHAYAASKGGLVALTHSLAVSLAPEVRVNCISPGWINVGGDPLSDEDHLQHPAGRVGTPADIAAAVEFLLDERAGFVTGTEWIIDGGMTRKMVYQ